MRPNNGQFNLRERLELIDGEFQVESQEGKGTRLTARVPVESGTNAEEELKGNAYWAWLNTHSALSFNAYPGCG